MRCNKERALTVEARRARAGVIDIVVNGDRLETQAATVADLVAELGLAGARVATARNGDFVPARARAATAIVPGDRIEIVSPRHGG
jgi:sulfur carrier protein